MKLNQILLMLSIVIVLYWNFFSKRENFETRKDKLKNILTGITQKRM